MPFEGVAEAHQLMRENKHQGKIAILVGADAGGPGQDHRGTRARSAPRSAIEPMELLAASPSVQRTSERKLMDAVQLDYVVTPFRAQKFVDLYRPAIKRPLSYGATGYLFYRNEEDSDHFVHLIFWEDRAGFQRWWFSQEMQDIRVATRASTGSPCCPSGTRCSSRASAGDRKGAHERGALSVRAFGVSWWSGLASRGRARVARRGDDRYRPGGRAPGRRGPTTGRRRPSRSRGRGTTGPRR